MKAFLSGLIFSLSVCTTLHAQQTGPIASGDLIRKGSRLHDEGKYKEAVTYYRQVPRNDTNYVLAQYELAYSLSSDSSYAEALSICRNALLMEEEDEELLLRSLEASIVDDMGDTEKSLRLYDSLLLKYPNAQNLWLNKAVSLMRLKKMDEAESLLKKLLIVNPFYYSAHFRLGQCALQKGNLVPALLCFYTYLVSNPSGSYARITIKALDNISKVVDDVQELVTSRTVSPEGSFASVEQIVLSKIALDKQYALHAGLDDPILRQLQVLMEKLEYEPDRDNFYMQYYVPYIKELFTEKLFEPAAYQAFSDLDIENIKHYVKKNTKEINAAKSVVSQSLSRILATRELNYAKRKNLPAAYYTENGILQGKGQLENGKTIGAWEFYYPNGNVKAKGVFNNLGSKEGKWVYYSVSGRLRGVDNWKDGKQEGEDLIYNAREVLTAKANYRNGQLHGEKISYFAIGHPQSITHFVNGKEQGSFVEFFPNGAKKIEAMSADDKFHGPYKSYFDNGQLESSYTNENGKMQGSYKSYFDNGQLEFEIAYEKGEANGEAKTYHRNGKLLRKTAYVNGLQEGEEIKYNDEGVVEQKGFYKKGKAEGTFEYNDHDGKLYSIIIFDNDKIKSAKYFDKSGKEISSSTRQGKTMQITTFNPEGFKNSVSILNEKGEKESAYTYYYNSGSVQATHLYKDGLLDGTTIGYYPDGSKQYEANYVQGKQDGLTKEYHPNGKLKSEGWYSNDALNGNLIEYNLKGNITSFATYLNGNLYGFMQNFLANGKPDDEEKYENGWLYSFAQLDTAGKPLFSFRLHNGSGTYKNIYPNGQIRYEGTMVNGNLHGTFTSYFFDGKVQVKKNYDHGTLDGDYIEYSYDGKLSTQGKYVKGKKTGIWKGYFTDGTLSREELYSDGDMNGKSTYYFNNGKPEREIYYRNDERYGSYTRYALDGQLCYIMEYYSDVPVSYTYKGRDGKLVPSIPIRGGIGKIVSYFSNGNKSAEMEFSDGKLKGKYVLYHPNGKIYYEDQETVYGLSNGNISEYNTNGQLISQYHYYYENQDGPYKEYHENGKLKEEGIFFLGYPHGDRIYYDISGKRTEKRTYSYGLLLNSTK